MPVLLKTRRYRLMTLFDLQRWRAAAQDVLEFLSQFNRYIDNEDVDAALKEATRKEFAQMVTRLHALSPGQLELLYTELGDDAEVVRSLVSAVGDEDRV